MTAVDCAHRLGFALRRGELHVVLGASGAGKTTLLRRIALESDEKIGYLTQDSGLLPWYTLRKNIALSCKSDPTPIIRELGITPLLDRYPGKISGGEARRAELAKILASGCSVLLLDEPTSSLDDRNRIRFLRLLFDIHHRHKLTTVVVTHELEDALLLGERISLMRNARMEQMFDGRFSGAFDQRDDLTFWEEIIRLRALLQIETSGNKGEESDESKHA